MDVGLDLEVKLICLKSGNANAKTKPKKHSQETMSLSGVLLTRCYYSCFSSRLLLISGHIYYRHKHF